ncbi:MAG: response regulator [Myxococcota bacterium]|jgi:CheY-like chemotaxis protein
MDNGVKSSVLVIDDERDMCEMLSFDLSAEGYEVTSASGGQEAVRMASGRRFNVAITDLRMPGMGGVETLCAIKAIDPEMEVIVATAYASIETASECMQGGAFAYIQKPYDLDNLRSLVGTAATRSRGGMVSVMKRAAAELELGSAAGDTTGGVLGAIKVALDADVVTLSPAGGPSHGPAMAVPVPGGVLTVLRTEGRPAFTPAQRELLQALASWAAQVLKSAPR